MLLGGAQLRAVQHHGVQPKGCFRGRAFQACTPWIRGTEPTLAGDPGD